MSLDTRLPVGITPTWSHAAAADGKLTLEFENIAFVGMGREVEGRMVHSNLVLTSVDNDHDPCEQYFTMSNGTGRGWVAAQYQYTRIR